MYAVRLDAVILKDRQLDLIVPEEIPEGEVEVIILSKAGTSSGNGQALLQYLREHRYPASRRRSAAQIDAQIAEERNAWE